MTNPVDKMFNKIARWLINRSPRARAWAILDASTSDSEKDRALVNQKRLDLLALLSTMHVEPERRFDMAAAEVKNFIYDGGKSIPDPHQFAAMRACLELISYLNATLAAERGESSQETWQRVAMNMAKWASRDADPWEERP
ncbi:hypothetical protein GCM10009530_63600 [Microbispora corallina]|uniref:Uncharacterized protein n=1 Tax=Microbispora corallina TaxID=83302 RepID=A0ABQ4GBH8_9ACTN|nr:hypothetical protein [Microbispora corallina]GIH44410.1 hypothetical protein Mco01_74100 [Microbispora corallina]